jgi:hypothetical protein
LKIYQRPMPVIRPKTDKKRTIFPIRHSLFLFFGFIYRFYHE